MHHSCNMFTILEHSLLSVLAFSASPIFTHTHTLQRGASYPSSGADGKWVEKLTHMGVPCHALDVSNCGFECDWQTDLSPHFGAPLNNIQATAFVDGTSPLASRFSRLSSLASLPLLLLSSALLSLTPF
jgi:hypothetical protein